MYNVGMQPGSYEIRICQSCGLRYPLLEGHPFGARCPLCMGDTEAVFSHPLNREAKRGGRATYKWNRPIAVLLDNIRSAWNVGSILRSADGFGFTHAYLCGITPSADHEGVTKTSLGAENSVPWSYHKDGVKLVKGLKDEGWNAYALEEDSRAVDIGNVKSKIAIQPEVLIIGNEVTGVDAELLDLCDDIFYIPMRGEKKSLNVAVAFSVAAYALNYQRMER